METRGENGKQRGKWKIERKMENRGENGKLEGKMKNRGENLQHFEV